MKQVILNIKEEKYTFFMELIDNLDFVEIQDDSGSKNVFNKNIKQNAF